MPLATVVIPRSGLQPTLDGDLLALAEVRAGDLGQAIWMCDLTGINLTFVP
jgi:hypothetical protein